MDRLELQKLRDLPIEGVAERLGLQVSRHKCLCPFHEDSHPSLSFRVSKNTYATAEGAALAGAPPVAAWLQRLWRVLYIKD